MTDSARTDYEFPQDFLWGTATASYQIEGAVHARGRGPSIWDTFSHTPGKVLLGQTGDIACDHFHRFGEDVRLMADLGLAAYRFSIAWPRVFPAKGEYLKSGFDFYKRLIESLQAHNIKPMATLYHWDLPQWLEDEGGWSNRDTVERYLEFADAAFEELGDGVVQWITHNEPWCASMLGYGMGQHAPGLTDWRRAYRAAHHLLLSHGRAVQHFRTLGLLADIGITLNLTPAYPATDSPEDQAAAHRQDTFSNRWFLNPVFKGQYPETFIDEVGRQIGGIDFIEPGDMDTIASPLDFLGINFYSRSVVRNNPNHSLLGVEQVKTDSPVTDMGWEVDSDALYHLLKRIQAEYTNLPLYITENGAAVADTVVDGKVDDPDRIAYVAEHLAAAHRFVAEGGNLKGYFLWSLLDNFEWALGYTKRFGIVYVDYETLERIPKSSYHWYKGVIANRGISIPAKLR